MPTSGHYGITKAMERVSKRFYWKGMVADVRDMVSHHNYNIFFYYFTIISYASCLI